MTNADHSDLSADAVVLKEQFERFREDFQTLKEEIGRIIVGQDDVVTGTLIALIAGGHVLLEGVPGLGKTMLVKTLAEAMHLQFSRIQFTPDLMPADLLGTSVVQEREDGSRRFEFQQGPIFSNVVLADEINRATPKTQSALLEAMAEQSVTVGGQSRGLPSPFLVLATQNPLEMEGTYALPEAQLDRFFVNLIVRYPDAEQMSEILNRTTGESVPGVQSVLDGERILAMKQLARKIVISDDVQQHAIKIVLGTHPDQPAATDSIRRFVRFGASPRGAQALILYSRILAVLAGRYNVSIDDIHAAAKPVLRHRIILSFEGQAENVSTDQVINDLISSLTSHSEF